MAAEWCSSAASTAAERYVEPPVLVGSVQIVRMREGRSVRHVELVEEADRDRADTQPERAPAAQVAL